MTKLLVKQEGMDMLSVNVPPLDPQAEVSRETLYNDEMNDSYRGSFRRH